MEVDCPGCGATLRLNPKLAGTAVPCPQCGTPVAVPEAAPPAPVPARPRTPAVSARKRKRRPPRYTLWLLAAQAALVALAGSCFAAVFWRDAWQPPAWSYFQENQLALVAVGVVLVSAAWLAHRLPVLTTLLVGILVLGACAWHFHTAGRVDASRALALAVAMLALWLALQHRRVPG